MCVSSLKSQVSTQSKPRPAASVDPFGAQKQDKATGMFTGGPHRQTHNGNKAAFGLGCNCHMSRKRTTASMPRQETTGTAASEAQPDDTEAVLAMLLARLETCQ